MPRLASRFRNAAGATAFYDKAANAFSGNRDADGKEIRIVATIDQLLAVKIRLVHALRMKKEYTAAEKLCRNSQATQRRFEAAD